MADLIDYPIQLGGVYFTRSIVESIPEHTPKNQGLSMGPDNKIRIEKNSEKPNSYLFVMHTKFNADRDPAEPYFIEMECVALLNVKDGLTEDEINKRVMITGHSVAYGAIREAVSWITSRHPFGALSFGLSVLQPNLKEEDASLKKS